ncbi:MAG TPA: metallophosphoesterase [Nitrososphaeraceae archaeon]|nr:metallophosphoesterase [Nitrososphaeraceae archaeon]
MISHQNFSIAYPYVNKVFDELNRYGIIPVQDTERDFETPSSSSNPNLDERKKKLCENGKQEDNNIGNPLICNPSEKTDDKSTDDQQNTEISDKMNKKIEKLNEKLEKSLSDNAINGKSQSEDSQSETENNDDSRGNTERNDDNNESNDNNGDNDANNDEDKQLLEQQQSSEDQEEEESKAEGGESNDNNNDNDDSRGNTERNDDNNESNDNEVNVGIAGLDSNIDKKLTDADKKIENLKDKINKENDNLLFEQQEENKAKEKDNKAKEKDNKAQDDNDQNLGITKLDSKIQKIQANLEKQIEKLKDKFENDRDNQRLIEQRNEFDVDDDDDEDDGDSKDGDDDDGKDYDGYGFNGDNDDGKENGEENFNFAAAGDFGCSTNTKNTVENMQSKGPEIVLALGDLSYHSTADCWFDIMSPIKDKLMITLGHHDVEDGQAKMDQYLNSFGLEKPFYSYEYNKVHFLVMSAKSVYYKGSEQYNFVLEDLKKASENKDVNWIVVSSYGPPYTSPSEHTAFKELRDVYHPIFEKYGVDLVLSGHNHNYQRTHPITYNPNDSSQPVVTNDRSTEYDSQKDGIVFALVGTGGVNFYSFDGQAPFVDTQFANKFGFLNIDISNGNPHTKLTGTFYDNKGDQILDQFTIDKEIKNKNSEVNSN